MLHLVIGPMFSGKTFHVIRLARRYRAIEKKVLFVDHISDTRYASEHLPSVVTHDGVKEKCLFLERLEDLMGSPEYHEAQVVVVEEAQFFPDVYEFLSRESDVSGKEFLVSGLAGDYKRKPIGNVLALIPFAEYVDKLNGLCNRCRDKTPGCFTRRLIESVGYDQMVVGGRETYECVCRKHLMMDTDMMETEMPTET